MLHFDPDEFDDETFVAYRRIETSAAMLTEADFELFDPPDEVWDGIAARLGDARESRLAGSSAPTLLVIDEPPAVESLDAVRERRAAANGVRRWVAPLSAAAATLLLAGVIWTTISDSDAGQVEIASAPLDELGNSGARADATLIRAEDGLHVVLSEAEMPPAPSGFYYEIWLVDGAVTDPHSLSRGAMGERVDFTIPSNLDPEAYPVIDVSLEPDDGNPAHSGAQSSVARGVLKL